MIELAVDRKMRFPNISRQINPHRKHFFSFDVDQAKWAPHWYSEYHDYDDQDDLIQEGSAFVNDAGSVYIGAKTQPVSVEDKDAIGEECDKSRESEINSFYENGAFEWVRPEDATSKPVHSRCIFTIKPNGRKKSRLVIKGFEDGERYGDRIDSAAATRCGLQFLLQLLAERQFRPRVLDVSAAFLQSLEEFLCRGVFVYPPKGFDIQVPFEGAIMRLKKSVCGLNNAPRAWGSAVAKWFTGHGFYQLRNGPAIFVLCSVTKSLQFRKKVTTTTTQIRRKTHDMIHQVSYQMER